MNNLVPEFFGIRLPDDFPGTGMNKIPFTVDLHRLHKRIRNTYRDIKVRQDALLFFSGDKIFNVGMIDIQYAHVGAPAFPALLDMLRRGVIDPEK